jgi:hypothetical protein
MLQLLCEKVYICIVFPGGKYGTCRLHVAVVIFPAPGFPGSGRQQPRVREA